MPIAKRMPLWDRHFIQGLALTFDRFAEAADLLEKAGRWDERWAAGSSEGKPGAFRPGDGATPSSASSQSKPDFGKPDTNQGGWGAIHRPDIQLAAAEEDDLIPGERDNLDETLEQNAQRLQSQAPISSRPLNLPSGPTYLTTPGTPLGAGGKPLTGPYANLRDPPTVEPGGNFARKQKANVYQQNMQTNGGVLRSDKKWDRLVLPKKSQKGVTPPPNEAQIDHITARKPSDPNMAPGTNSYGNAQVLSREENRDKTNKRRK